MGSDHANEGRREDSVFLMLSVRQINIVALCYRFFDEHAMKCVFPDANKSADGEQAFVLFFLSKSRS